MGCSLPLRNSSPCLINLAANSALQNYLLQFIQNFRGASGNGPDVGNEIADYIFERRNNSPKLFRHQIFLA